MSISAETRRQLLELVTQIVSARDSGRTCKSYLSQFEELLPGTDVDNLCNSDYPQETILEVCLGEKDARKLLTKIEFYELTKKLCSTEPGAFISEGSSINAVLAFNYNCRHLGKSDLIFFPEEHFEGRSDPTPEEILEKAMNGE